MIVWLLLHHHGNEFLGSSSLFVSMINTAGAGDAMKDVEALVNQ